MFYPKLGIPPVKILAEIRDAMPEEPVGYHHGDLGIQIIAEDGNEALFADRHFFAFGQSTPIS